MAQQPLKGKLIGAVFLDRDGTIIEDRGHLSTPADVVFFPETISALKRLQDHFLLFIVTHQPGISKRILSEDDVNRVNNHVVSELSRHGVRISEVYYCPHSREERCSCIKPEPFFLKIAAEKYGLDLGKSFVIGDHPHDVQLAENAGAEGVYVLTGHGLKHRCELTSGKHVVVNGISEAADWIIAKAKMTWLEKEMSGFVEKAADLLKRGGVVAFPTETVYGLGAIATDQHAVARIFEIKGRPRFDPLIVHIDNLDRLNFLAADVPASARILIERFWPGPLTLVLPKTENVPDIVTAGLPTVAIRMPRHPLALKLIKMAGSPIAAPSANLFGRASPTTAQHVLEQLEGKVDMVLDGGPCSVGVESTIIAFCPECPVLLRPGGIPVEDIEREIGPISVNRTSGDHHSVLAPGMMPRHYAPGVPLKIIRENEPLPKTDGKRVGLLTLNEPSNNLDFEHVEILSETGNLREAAANLFSALRSFDSKRLDLIIARLVPERGLGLAINDRLIRASGEMEKQ